MKLILFSDILDPWGFGFEKDLRALKFLFPDFSYEFNMIGLMENYQEFLPENFRKFNSDKMGEKIIYDMFIAASTMTKMPTFKKPPKLFDENNKGSDLLNKYFVTVKNINRELSNKYIRRVREYMVFLEEEISKLEVQKKILNEIGLDMNDFNDDFMNSSEYYLQDKIFSFDFRVKNAPAFLVTEKNKLIKSFMDFTGFKKLVKEEMGLKMREIKNTKEEVYDFLDRFENVLEIELSLLFEKDIIDEMYNKKEIFLKDYGNIKVVAKG